LDSTDSPALATPAVVERIAALGTPLSKIVVELIEFSQHLRPFGSGFAAA